MFLRSAATATCKVPVGDKAFVTTVGIGSGTGTLGTVTTVRLRWVVARPVLSQGRVGPCRCDGIHCKLPKAHPRQLRTTTYDRV